MGLKNSKSIEYDLCIVVSPSRLNFFGQCFVAAVVANDRKNISRHQ